MAVDPKVLLGVAISDKEDVGLGSPQPRGDFRPPHFIRAAVVGARHKQTWVQLAQPLGCTQRNPRRRPQEEDPPLALCRPFCNAIDPVRPGYPLGHRLTQEAGGPQHAHAVRRPYVSTPQHAGKRCIAARIDDKLGVDGADLPADLARRVRAMLNDPPVDLIEQAFKVDPINVHTQDVNAVIAVPCHTPTQPASSWTLLSGLEQTGQRLACRLLP